MNALAAAVLAALWAAAPARSQPLPIHPIFDAGCDRTLDLRSGSMANVAVRQQDRENECYAEAASQLIDAWRFAHGDTNTGHQTSGFALALQVNSDVLGSGIARPDLDVLGPELGPGYAFGETCMAVEAALERGSCDARAVLTNLDGLGLTGTVAALRGYYDDYQAWYETHAGLSTSIETILSGTESKRTLTARLLESRLARLREGLRVPAEALGPLLDATPRIRYLQGVMTYACEHGHTVRVRPEPDCGREPFATAESAYLRILSRLRRSRQPIAIGYCGGIVASGRAFESQFAEELPAATRMANPAVCIPHQSLVIGVRRHPETRKCQFLVRNSLGPGLVGSSDWQFESGNVWIDAQNLAYNTWLAQFLE